MQSRACTSYAEAMVFFEALASKIARASGNANEFAILDQSDLKSDCCEYQDLQSENRISNAYIHCGRIVNLPERSLLILPRVSNFAESKTAEALIG
jgi:hypothetical protein